MDFAGAILLWPGWRRLAFKWGTPTPRPSSRSAIASTDALDPGRSGSASRGSRAAREHRWAVRQGGTSRRDRPVSRGDRRAHALLRRKPYRDRRAAALLRRRPHLPLISAFSSLSQAAGRSCRDLAALAAVQQAPRRARPVLLISACSSANVGPFSGSILAVRQDERSGLQR